MTDAREHFPEPETDLTLADLLGAPLAPLGWSTLVLSAALAVLQERARAAKNPGGIHIQRSLYVMTHLHQNASMVRRARRQQMPVTLGLPIHRPIVFRIRQLEALQNLLVG
jgi:hypothetical protein